MDPMTEVPSSRDLAVLVGDFPDFTPEDLFAHFTLPDKLTQWWPEQAEVDLRVGGRYRMLWPNPDWTIQGEYTAVESPRHLGFTWQGDPDAGEASQVDLWIDRLEDGCRLAVWHRGFADETERRQLCEGWIHFGMRLAGVATPDATD
jgi:uncharacterized protein YndB with AHSA1/START domain